MGTKARYIGPEELVRLESQGRLFIPSNSVIYKRSLLLPVGGLDADLKWHCDWFVTHNKLLRGRE